MVGASKFTAQRIVQIGNLNSLCFFPVKTIRIGQKASDLDTVPACRLCHMELHRLGRVRFEMLHQLDFAQAILTLQTMYTARYGRLPGEDQEKAA